TRAISLRPGRLARRAPLGYQRHSTMIRAARAVGSFYCWSWVAFTGCLASIAALLLTVPFNPWVDPNRRAMDMINHLWGRFALWGLPRISAEYVGLERVRQAKEPYLVCANHQSVADVIVLLSAFPHVKFLVKRQMFL